MPATQATKAGTRGGGGESTQGFVLRLGEVFLFRRLGRKVLLVLVLNRVAKSFNLLLLQVLVDALFKHPCSPTKSKWVL